MSKPLAFLFIMLSAYIVFIITAITVQGIVENRFHIELISKGYGEYCKDTLKFAYIGEC